MRLTKENAGPFLHHIKFKKGKKYHRFTQFFAKGGEVISGRSDAVNISSYKHVSLDKDVIEYIKTPSKRK